MTDCKRLILEKDVCTVLFRPRGADAKCGCIADFPSVLGHIYVHANAKGEVVEIEILGDCPCQRMDESEKSEVSK